MPVTARSSTATTAARAARGTSATSVPNRGVMPSRWTIGTLREIGVSPQSRPRRRVTITRRSVVDDGVWNEMRTRASESTGSAASPSERTRPGSVLETQKLRLARRNLPP